MQEAMETRCLEDEDRENWIKLRSGRKRHEFYKTTDVMSQWLEMGLYSLGIKQESREKLEAHCNVLNRQIINIMNNIIRNIFLHNLQLCMSTS
jgi:uncharacterized protein YgfB (UPF0149 family)